MEISEKQILLGEYNAIKAETAKNVSALGPTAPKSEVERHIKKDTATRFRLERRATTDALTELKNRRAFDETLDLELARMQEHETRHYSGLDLGLVVADVRRLKTINDELGHPGGDRHLQSLADTMKKAGTRRTDTVFRTGGDEFSILLRDVSQEGRMPQGSPKDGLVAAALRVLVSVHSMPTEKPMHLDMGVTLAQTTDTRELVCKRADDAGYIAKRMFASSDNKVVVATPSNEGVLYEVGFRGTDGTIQYESIPHNIVESLLLAKK